MTATLPRPKSAVKGKGGAKTPTIVQAPPTASDSPIRLHRTWKGVPTKNGNIEQMLREAGMGVQLIEIREILSRCPAGAALDISAFEVTRPAMLGVILKALDREGFAPCCSCEFAFWAIGHGGEAHKQTLWTGLALRKTSDRKTVCISLLGNVVRAEIAPDGLTQRTMILAVPKKQAEKLRQW